MNEWLWHITLALNLTLGAVRGVELKGWHLANFFLEIKSLWEDNHWLESVSLERTKLRSPGPRSTEAKSSLRLAATLLNLPRTEWQPAGNAQPGQRCLRSQVLAEWSKISSNSAHLFFPSRLSYFRGPHPECGEEGLLNRGAEAFRAAPDLTIYGHRAHRTNRKWVALPPSQPRRELARQRRRVRPEILGYAWAPPPTPPHTQPPQVLSRHCPEQWPPNITNGETEVSTPRGRRSLAWSTTVGGRGLAFRRSRLGGGALLPS